MGRHLLATIGIGIVIATIAGAALGGGAPGPGLMQGWDGAAGGNVRYVALQAGSGTVIEAVRMRSGRVLRYAMLDGDYGIPQIANDGTTGGLSHDGRTLVLGDLNNGLQQSRTSSFAVVDARRLRLRSMVHLQGDFSFDALSPGARMLYVIEHVSGQDGSRYRVRAYDLGGRRLLPQVVVDKSSWESVMRGYPYSRVATKEGRWVYTLYGGGEHPFVHALDTQNVNAVCLDLPKSWNRLDVGGMRLRLTADGKLVVRYRAGGRPLAVFDPASRRVLRIVRNP